MSVHRSMRKSQIFSGSGSDSGSSGGFHPSYSINQTSGVARLSIGAQVLPLRVGELARDELVEF
jgi:hypothetical protein